MILDNEAQRELLLKMFDGVNFPGSVLEQAFTTKLAIQMAEIKKQPEAAPES